jgi:hypothetical protein
LAVHATVLRIDFQTQLIVIRQGYYSAAPVTDLIHRWFHG